MSETEKVNAVGAYDAKTRFSELLERAAGGEEITITRHGTPVARLVPFKARTSPAERREAIAAWRKSSKGLNLGGLKIKDLITEGRR